MIIKEPEPTKPAQIPYHSTTKRELVDVPLQQTLIHAGLWGLAPAAVVCFVLWGLANAEVVIPFKWCAFAVALGFCSFFIPVSIREWPKNRDHGDYIIEVLMGADLNQDGVIGDPGKQPAPRLDVTVNNGQQRPEERDQLEHDEIPFADRLPQLARALATGAHFTYQEWAGKGRLFSQPEWVRLTDYLREKGYIQYKNPRATGQGYDFTHKGGAFMQSLITEGRRIETELTQIPMKQYAATTPTPRGYGARI